MLDFLFSECKVALKSFPLWPQDRIVWVRALAGNIELFSWA